MEDGITTVMYGVPYGKEEITFDLLPGMRATEIHSQPIPPLGDVPSAIDKALAEPVNSAPLKELVKRGDTACIVFTDITRACPDYLLIPPILRELHKAGVRREDITLFCGTGLHRPSTQEERVAKLGPEVAAHYRVLDNEPQNPAAIVELGKTGGGVPLSVHKTAYDADLLIATGIVEPHQYAGYSGARKTVAIGAAGEKTIAYTHGPAMVDHPGTRLGLIGVTPFTRQSQRRPGAQRAFVIAKVMEVNPVVIVGSEFPEIVKETKMIPATTIEEALEFAVSHIGRSDLDVLIIPHALLTLPYIKNWQRFAFPAQD